MATKLLPYFLALADERFPQRTGNSASECNVNNVTSEQENLLSQNNEWL
jgi:hypothetical protein